MISQRYFGKVKDIQFKLRFIITLALFLHTNGVQLGEKNREMIKEAIDSFTGEAANLIPVVVKPSLPAVTNEWLPDPERYMTLPYIMFHPLVQFPSFFRQSPILCPVCQKDGVMSALTSTDKWRGGRNARSATQPRLIYGIDCPVLLVSKVYKCPNGHSEIPANDPDIIKRIPQSHLPFMLTHKSGLTTELLLYVEDLIDSGVSIGAIESIIRCAYKRHSSLREERFWIDSRLAISMNNEAMAVDMSCPFPVFKDYPSSHLITDIVVSHFQINEVFYCNYFSSLGARWLSCDHTFKAAMNVGYFRHSDNKWINQYRSLFCILNEFGQVIQWQLTASEGFEEVRPMFMDLKKRLDKKYTVPEGVFIDNCCKWREAIHSVFPKIPVKLDLFHAIQRIVKKIPKRKKLSKDMANDIGLIFRATNDYGENRKCNTPKPADIIENFRKFEKKWKNPKYKNGTNILSKEIRKEMKKLMVHAEKGCLSGIPPSCSTSRNQRLHKDLNKFIRSSRLGVELAYTRIFRTLYLHNKKKDLSAKTIYESRASVAKEAYQTAVDANYDLGNTILLEGVNFEVFGIRPKVQDCEVGAGSLPNEGEKMDEFSYNVLMDIRSSLQSSMKIMDEENKEKMSESILCDILSQTLGWWATALTLESLLGKRVVDRRKVQSIAKARLNTSTIGISKLSSSSRKTWDREAAQRLHEMAGMWGFSIVNIAKNGNAYSLP